MREKNIFKNSSYGVYFEIAGSIYYSRIRLRNSPSTPRILILCSDSVGVGVVIVVVIVASSRLVLLVATSSSYILLLDVLFFFSFFFLCDKKSRIAAKLKSRQTRTATGDDMACDVCTTRFVSLCLLPLVAHVPCTHASALTTKAVLAGESVLCSSTPPYAIATQTYRFVSVARPYLFLPLFLNVVFFSFYLLVLWSPQFRRNFNFSRCFGCTERGV